MLTKILICLLTMISFNQMRGQTLVWSDVIKSTGGYTDAPFISGMDFSTFTGGIFTGSLNNNGQDIISLGASDLFVRMYDASGGLKWTLAGGSKGAETLDAFIAIPGEGLWISGTYWDTLKLGNRVLVSELNSKSAYLVKIDTFGDVIAAYSVYADGEKKITSLESDQAGGIYFAGYFSGRCVVGDKSLIASGEKSPLVGHLLSSGAVSALTSFPNTVDARVNAISYDPAFGLAVTGAFFLGNLILGKDTLTSFTPDFDVFTVRLNPDLSPLWGRKAGGVYDDISTNITISSGGISVNGYYTGVMKLDDEHEQQTQGTQSDLFAAGYGPDGQVLYASANDSPASESDNSWASGGPSDWISGIYSGAAMTAGTLSLPRPGNGANNGFLMKADAGTLNADRLYPIVSDINITKAASAIYGDQNHVGLAVGFKGKLQVPYSQAELTQSYGIWVGRYDFTPIVSAENPVLKSSFRIIPNPAGSRIRIEGLDTQEIACRITGVTGQSLYSTIYNGAVDISTLLPGFYFLTWKDSFHHTRTLNFTKL